MEPRPEVVAALIAADKIAKQLVNMGRLVDQVAAEARVSPRYARAAIFFFTLAKHGLTVDEIAKRMRVTAGRVKDYARDLLIDLPDYKPFAGKAYASQRAEMKPRVKLDFDKL